MNYLYFLPEGMMGSYSSLDGKVVARHDNFKWRLFVNNTEVGSERYRADLWDRFHCKDLSGYPHARAFYELVRSIRELNPQSKVPYESIPHDLDSGVWMADIETEHDRLVVQFRPPTDFGITFNPSADVLETKPAEVFSSTEAVIARLRGSSFLWPT